jgi:4-hydroxy-tetrahydrodipicolinate reductase
MIKLCVAGVTGRMGGTLVHEAVNKDFQIVGAVAAPEDPKQNRTLRELGLCNSDLVVIDPSSLEEAIAQSDVYISFTSPEAELSNIPKVASMGKRIVMGTTGFTGDQMYQLRAVVSPKVPAVFAPNFAIGVNILFRILKAFKSLPKDYEISIFEAHHSGKKDAPSGTAMSIAKQISDMRGYETTIHSRREAGMRKPGEIEVVAIRAGGIPGIHTVIAAGPHEMLSIEHLSFSRRVFAQGALYAAEWLMRQTNPGVYSLDDVLSV